MRRPSADLIVAITVIVMAAWAAPPAAHGQGVGDTLQEAGTPGQGHPTGVARQGAEGGGEQKAGALTLERALDLALTNNAAIRESLSRRLASIEGRKAALADFFPKLGAAYSYTNLEDQPYTIVGGTKLPVSSDEVFRWQVYAAQPIFTGFALSSRYEMARLGVDLGEAECDLARMETTRRVKEAYYGCLLAKRALDVSVEATDALMAHVKDAERFYDQGMIPFNDLLKSKVALAAAQQSEERARANLEAAISGLNTLLGLEVDRPTEIEDITGAPPLAYDPARLMEAALENRPEIRSLKIALMNAAAAARLARSSFYPSVSLLGAYERTGDDPRASNNDYGNDHNTSIALEAGWQFFEWGKTRAEVKKAEWEKQALEERLRALKDAVRIEVKNAALDARVAEKNIASAREALEQARENYRITNLQYRQQITSSTEVLDARTYLSQAQMNYYGALYGYLSAIARLERASGVTLSGPQPNTNGGS
ncbi:MAG TPA: TolC family protein [Deltaproteobacteria bacterium]|nr:TolC family protein [Deltaproteobacteria bacterium]HPP81084.1 TolC family protein [Deltaproteobacteria bacterium]